MRIFPALTAMVLLVAGCGGRDDIAKSVRWPVMGTVAAISFKGPVSRSACDDVRSVYAEVERMLSAHDSGSEASRFRSLEGVSSFTRPCYEAAFKLQELSAGAFNPFWRGKLKGPDLGAIAKGFAVDVACSRIVGNGTFKDALVDLGGNLKVVSGTWITGIRDPRDPEGIVARISLTNGMACATSGEYVRGKHIYDGRTGKPVSNDVASVTVVHPTSAMMADGLSTTLFVLGRKDGEAFLNRYYPEAVAYWVMRTVSRPMVKSH